jgi:hypothetical protein
LDRSRRVDQDPYIERPIQSPDERDMTSARSGRRTGRLDRGSTGLTGSGLCKLSWSCILAEDLLGLQLQQGPNLPTLLISMVVAD